MPADLSTAAGYRAFLVVNGNPPSMVEELVRSRAFPVAAAPVVAGRTEKRRGVRRAEPGEQLAFDLAESPAA